VTEPCAACVETIEKAALSLDDLRADCRCGNVDISTAQEHIRSLKASHAEDEHLKQPCPACVAAVRLANNTVVGGRAVRLANNLSIGRSVDAYVASQHSEDCPNAKVTNG